jgi:predicted DNA-binding protein (UPF0251 family)
VTGMVVPSIFAESDVLLDPRVVEMAASGGFSSDDDVEDDSAREETALPKEWVLAPEDIALLEQGFQLSGDKWGADRNLWMYRDRTIALLKRYARLSVEVGRLPSLLGREFFRAKVTSYHISTFEDTVIFVHDVEQSLERLDWFEKKVIAMVILEEFSQEEAAQLLQCSPRTVGRYIHEAIDGLSEIFLRGSILKPMVRPVPNRETACQGGKSDPFPASDCNEGKNKFQKMSDYPQ